MTRILLVGTGITSAVTGALIKQKLPRADLIIWDKARGAGGRMSTARNPNDESCTLDLGAQYISTTPDYAEVHRSYYEELQKAGLLVPFSAKVGGMRPSNIEGTVHYVTPLGVSSLVKYYLGKINSKICYQHHVEKIDYDKQKWIVRTQNGVEDNFDVVVLTMPVPQILGLTGKIKSIIEENNLDEPLKEVEYSSRYALGLFFSKDSKISLSNGNIAEYITDDPIMRFVSIDNLKRGRNDVNPSVVFHTSVPFGKAYVEKTPSEVEPILLAKVKEMFPHWPEPNRVKCHKWRFSQVSLSYPGLPGAIEIGKGLIAGGDGFTGSTFNSCIESAKTISDLVTQFRFAT
ncbi:UNVERIFIED_CONTAM: hypothetical protein RMT77_006578 [Armadillidium vulgare]